jgi:hypothetical protein
MQKAKHVDLDVFADVMGKIKMLTDSQRRYIQEMITLREKKVPVTRIKLLRKSFGVWAGRKDIKDSEEYVDALRKGWSARIERGNR